MSGPCAAFVHEANSREQHAADEATKQQQVW